MNAVRAVRALSMGESLRERTCGARAVDRSASSARGHRASATPFACGASREPGQPGQTPQGGTTIVAERTTSSDQVSRAPV